MFVGWKVKGTADSQIVTVNATATSNCDYVAVFTAQVKKYDVNFYDSDNATLLYTATDVAYGLVPTYGGQTPTKDGFTFVGWNKTLEPVNGQNLRYFASYQQKTYALTVLGAQGCVVNAVNLPAGTVTVAHGTQVTFVVTVSQGYEGQVVFKANGQVIQQTNGKYNLTVTQDVTITVEGIVEHQHSYDVESKTNDALKTPANCSSGAIYYYSCRCGRCDKSLAQTFTDGVVDATNHTSSNYYYQQNATAGTHIKLHSCCNAVENANAPCLFGSWVVTAQPSENAYGRRECVCSQCDGVKVENITTLDGQLTLSTSMVNGSIINQDGAETGYVNASGGFTLDSPNNYLKQNAQKAKVSGTATEWRYFRYTIDVDFTKFNQVSFKLQTNVSTNATGGF